MSDDDSVMRDQEQIHSSLPIEMQQTLDEYNYSVAERVKDCLYEYHVGAGKAITNVALARQVDALVADRGGDLKPKNLTYIFTTLIKQGHPIGIQAHGPKRGRGVFICQTQEEINRTVEYRRKQASGSINTADALAELPPHGGGVSDTGNLDTPPQTPANAEENVHVSKSETVEQVGILTHPQAGENI